MGVILSPSLLSADFSRLAEEINDVEKAGAEWLHLDIMDGLFVPNITFGAPVIKKIRPHSSLFFDCHLMIAEPSRYIEAFSQAGVDLITVHEEATRDIKKTLNDIHSLGCQAGLSVNPNTSIDAIVPFLNDADLILLMSVHPGFGGQEFIDITYKLKACKKLMNEKGSMARLEVDGGINSKTAPMVVKAGADVLVAGSSIFGKENRKKAIDELRLSLKGIGHENCN